MSGDTNGKMFWQTIRPFLSNKGGASQNTIVLRELDDIKTNPSEVCEIINVHFLNVASDIGRSQNCIDYTNHPSITAIQNGSTHPESFAFKPVGHEEVYRKLNNLKCNKVTGCDQMPAKVLKIVSQNLATPLASIINASINQSRFPQDLKLADVSPVYNKKDNLNKENYRPVSILPSVSKIYENLMGDQLTDHFENIFDKLLSGLRTNMDAKHLC